MRYAVVEDAEVVNVILWDGLGDAPSGQLVQLEEDSPVGAGWRRVGDEWSEPVAPTESRNPSVDELRRVAYRDLADPLFFKWQRGEAAQRDWLDAVAEVRARYPDSV